MEDLIITENSELSNFLEEKITYIQQRQLKMVSNVIEIGKILCEIRDRCKEIAEQEKKRFIWQNIIKDNCRISSPSIENYINIYTRFDNQPDDLKRRLINLGIGKMSLLARLPGEVKIEDVLDSSIATKSGIKKVEDFSSTEMQQFVKYVHDNPELDNNDITLELMAEKYAKKTNVYKQLEDTTKKLETKVQVKEEQIATLEEKHDKIMQENANLESKMTEVEDEKDINNLKKQLNEKTQQVDKISKRLDKERQQKSELYHNVKKRFQGAITTLKQQNHSAFSLIEAALNDMTTEFSKDTGIWACDQLDEILTGIKNLKNLIENNTHNEDIEDEIEEDDTLEED